MKTINEKNGLSIEQLEERFEMTVAASKSEGGPGSNPSDGMWSPLNNDF
jgi:hypothetical protein